MHCHFDFVAGFFLAFDDLEGDLVEKGGFDHAFERARAVLWVVAGFGECAFDFGGDAHGETIFVQTFFDDRELHLDDVFDLVFAELFENDDVVEAVEELGAEESAQFVLGQVASHDDDGVFKVDDAALAVGESTVVENLEENIKDLWMGFFDFVEQDDGIRAAADFFGELSTFFVTDVTWWSTDQTCDVVAFSVFGHVDADHGVFVVE